MVPPCEDSTLRQRRWLGRDRNAGCRICPKCTPGMTEAYVIQTLQGGCKFQSYTRIWGSRRGPRRNG